MATAQVTPITAYDEYGKPVQSPSPQAPVTAYDEQGRPVDTQGLSLSPDEAQRATDALVYSHMTGAPPSFTYDAADEIHRQTQAIDGDYRTGDLDPTILNDIKVGYEESIYGLYKRKQLPDTLRNPSKIDEFISGIATMIPDLPAYAAGGFAGGAAGSEVPVVGTAIGGAAGAFALPAAIRQTLVDGIKNGSVKSFGDLMHRAARTTWAATKGAAVGALTELSGGLPVGGLVAKSPVGSMVLRGLYKAATITTFGDLLDGRVPNASDFAKNAALIVPLSLVTHGLSLKSEDAKQATMDVYAKDGIPPEATAEKLAAQPPVKPDLAPGLRPAIKVGDAVVEGDEGETHAELAERATGQTPVTMEQLEVDPTLADKVLESPEIHDQEEVDQAAALKKEAIEAGNAEAQDVKPGTSGRGFVTPDGKFLTREQAESWVKENEPEVHEMWENEPDAQASLRSEDYSIARMRVQGRNLAEGEPDYKGMGPQLASFLSTAREELNPIKADIGKSSAYGNSVIRTLFVGPRNLLRAEGEQLASRLKKLVPDSVDQEALHFMRDYRDDPDKLRSEIEQARSSEKLKAFIPSMERALNPTPQMLQADAQLTQYFSKALDMGKQLGIFDSSVDPSRYSPRLFMKVMDDAENARAAGRPKFTQRTPNAIRREYLHALDPLKLGNIEQRTFNAFDELSVYADRFSTAAATKMFLTELKNSEMGKWGTANTVPEGWVQLAPTLRGFSRTILIPDKTGENQGFSQAFYVPKTIATAMKPILDTGGVPSQLLNVLHLQNYVKGIELSLSVFHMKALTLTAMNNMGLKGYEEALHSDNSAPDFESKEQKYALYGLTTTKTDTPYEAYRGLKPSSLPTGLDKIRNLPVLKQVDAFAQSLTRATFDIIQRKVKVTDMAGKESSWIAKNPEASEVEYAKAMRGIAKEVNSAYGNLNWEVMGVSKQMRDISRLFILAPDWTFSNVANLKYAGEGGPAGSAARMFWVKSFATGIAMSQGMSIMLTGHMSKNPTSVYLGKDKEGKEMYSNVFFAGAPKDAITLVNRVAKDGLLEGLVGFAANKFGPIAATAKGLMTNKQFSGAPISKESDTQVEKNVKQAEFAGGELLPVPFGIKDVTKLLTDPQADTSKWDYVLPLLGTYASHQVPTDPADAAKVKAEEKQAKKAKAAETPQKPRKRFSIRSSR